MKRLFLLLLLVGCSKNDALNPLTIDEVVRLDGFYNRIEDFLPGSEGTFLARTDKNVIVASPAERRVVFAGDDRAAPEQLLSPTTYLTRAAAELGKFRLVLTGDSRSRPLAREESREGLYDEHGTFLEEMVMSREVVVPGGTLGFPVATTLVEGSHLYALVNTDTSFRFVHFDLSGRVLEESVVAPTIRDEKTKKPHFTYRFAQQLLRGKNGHFFAFTMLFKRELKAFATLHGIEIKSEEPWEDVLLELDAKGRVLWALPVRIGKTWTEVARLAFIEDKLYVLGSYSDDPNKHASKVYVAKVTPRTSELNVKRIDRGETMRANDLSHTPKGLYVCGTVDFGQAPTASLVKPGDAFLLRLDLELNETSFTRFGGGRHDSFQTLRTHEGRLYVSGNLDGPLTHDDPKTASQSAVILSVRE